MRNSFDSVTLSIDDKALGPKIAKMGEMKKAMPFVQGLKKRLLGGEKGEVVFERKLAFDELEVLGQMRAGLRKTTGCQEVEVVAVEDGGRRGKLVGGGHGEALRENLPVAAQVAVPGAPSFHFENVGSSVGS